jgi:hypothetical protein
MDAFVRTYSLTHLTDAAVARVLPEVVRRDNMTTAELLAYVGEFQERKLYRPAGYASMHEYLIEELHMSEDAAYQRTHLARKARQFPALLDALADGRIHLAGVRLLAPRLTPESADALIAAATHKTKTEIERLLNGSPRRPEMAEGPQSAAAAPDPGFPPGQNGGPNLNDSNAGSLSSASELPSAAERDLQPDPSGARCSGRALPAPGDREARLRQAAVRP